VSEARKGRPQRSVPQRAEGVELIGEYEGSGFKETPYLARRADGQVLQLTELLYLVAEEVDGKRTFREIAGRVSERFGRRVSADNVKFLVEKKLRPLGVLAAADGTTPRLKKADPMLALNLRTGVIPERTVRAITTVFYPLFFPPVVVAVLVAFATLDAWLFFVHGVSQSARELIYQPLLFLMVFGLIILSTAFHEFGHATACRYGGATPGVIGVGIYLVYPAFFSDVTDAYRLDRVGRVRTDLGGIYFNIIFCLLAAGAYFYTGFEPLLSVIVIQHFEIVHQLLPFLRLDGYYVVADLTGVPDLFARMGPILRSLVPGRAPDTSVTALKPWVRVVVTAWVLAVVPILLYMFTVAAMTAPRLFATAYDSFFVQYDKIADALYAGREARAAVGSIQTVSLVLPLAGLTYTFGRMAKRLGLAAWNLTEEKPTLRAGFASTALLAVGVTAFLWWPNGDYRPVQATERGTIQGGLHMMRDIPSGRPSLTAEREVELKGAPTLRQQSGQAAGGTVNHSGSTGTVPGAAPPSTGGPERVVEPREASAQPRRASAATQGVQQSQSPLPDEQQAPAQPAVQKGTAQPTASSPATQQGTPRPATQQGASPPATQTASPSATQTASRPATQEASPPATQTASPSATSASAVQRPTPQQQAVQQQSFSAQETTVP
jgi:putative peptide zinc metalloprotease protein